MNRNASPGTLDRVRALLTSPALYETAALFGGPQPVGRPSANPTYVLLAYGALARLARSAVRVETDLAEPTLWAFARDLMISAPARQQLQLPPPGDDPPRWDHWRWFRDHTLTTDEGIAALEHGFPLVATAQARRISHLDPRGPGSYTHPHASRAVYGDGTSIAPIYRPPDPVVVQMPNGSRALRYRDPQTGQLSADPVRRFDPDLRDYHGHAPWELNHSYVAYHVRTPTPYRRIILAISHVARPGAEAATAVELLREVHRAAGTGVQVVIYDGAFTGIHIDTVMTRYGYLVICKSPAGDDPADLAGTEVLRTPDGKRARSYPLGTVHHSTPAGPCDHVIAAVDSRLVLVDLDERGDPTILATAERGPIKHNRRTNGNHHFNIGYVLPCPIQPFSIWLSPHADAPGDASRPHNLRAIPEGDPDYYILRGLRSDAENNHTNLKRTLIVGRAMSIGWRRVLIDYYAYALLSNALTEHIVAREGVRGASRPLSAAGAG
jgi:hypothetical protein